MTVYGCWREPLVWRLESIGGIPDQPQLRDTNHAARTMACTPVLMPGVWRVTLWRNRTQSKQQTESEKAYEELEAAYSYKKSLALPPFLYSDAYNSVQSFPRKTLR